MHIDLFFRLLDLKGCRHVIDIGIERHYTTVLVLFDDDGGLKAKEAAAVATVLTFPFGEADGRLGAVDGKFGVRIRQTGQVPDPFQLLLDDDDFVIVPSPA